MTKTTVSATMSPKHSRESQGSKGKPQCFNAGRSKFHDPMAFSNEKVRQGTQAHETYGEDEDERENTWPSDYVIIQYVAM